MSASLRASTSDCCRCAGASCIFGLGASQPAGKTKVVRFFALTCEFRCNVVRPFLLNPKCLNFAMQMKRSHPVHLVIFFGPLLLRSIQAKARIRGPRLGYQSDTCSRLGLFADHPAPCARRASGSRFW